MIVNDAFEDILNVIIIVIHLNTNHTPQQTNILTYSKKHLHRNVVKIVPSNIQLMQHAHRLSCAQHLAHTNTQFSRTELAGHKFQPPQRLQWVALQRFKNGDAASCTQQIVTEIEFGYGPSTLKN
jgi:hypothetical protein